MIFIIQFKILFYFSCTKHQSEIILTILHEDKKYLLEDNFKILWVLRHPELLLCWALNVHNKTCSQANIKSYKLAIISQPFSRHMRSKNWWIHIFLTVFRLHPSVSCLDDHIDGVGHLWTSGVPDRSAVFEGWRGKLCSQREDCWYRRSLFHTSRWQRREKNALKKS